MTITRIGATPRVSHHSAHALRHIAAPRTSARPATLPAGGARSAKARSAAEVFEAMRKAFRPNEAAGVKAKYQFNLSGAGGGQWYIIVDDGKATVSTGSIGGADVTFRATASNWVKLSNGDLSGTWAFMTGKLKIDGDHGLARKLDKMFP